MDKINGYLFLQHFTWYEKQVHANGQITKDFDKANRGGINKLFYICGPPPGMEAIEKPSTDLHENKKTIVKESF